MLDQSEKWSSLSGVIYGVMDTQLYKFCRSIVLLWLMLHFRKELTPACVELMTAFSSGKEHEECCFLWVMTLWLTSRAFFNADLTPE